LSSQFNQINSGALIRLHFSRNRFIYHPKTEPQNPQFHTQSLLSSSPQKHKFPHPHIKFKANQQSTSACLQHKQSQTPPFTKITKTHDFQPRKQLYLFPNNPKLARQQTIQCKPKSHLYNIQNPKRSNSLKKTQSKSPKTNTNSFKHTINQNPNFKSPNFIYTTNSFLFIYHCTNQNNKNPLQFSH
jgi:hypothetical protein